MHRVLGTQKRVTNVHFKVNSKQILRVLGQWNLFTIHCSALFIYF